MEGPSIYGVFISIIILSYRRIDLTRHISPNGIRTRQLGQGKVLTHLAPSPSSGPAYMGPLGPYLTHKNLPIGPDVSGQKDKGFHARELETRGRTSEAYFYVGVFFFQGSCPTVMVGMPYEQPCSYVMLGTYRVLQKRLASSNAAEKSIQRERRIHGKTQFNQAICCTTFLYP